MHYSIVTNNNNHYIPSWTYNIQLCFNTLASPAIFGIDNAIDPCPFKLKRSSINLLHVTCSLKRSTVSSVYFEFQLIPNSGLITAAKTISLYKILWIKWNPACNISYVYAGFDKQQLLPILT